MPKGKEVRPDKAAIASINEGLAALRSALASMSPQAARRVAGDIGTAANDLIALKKEIAPSKKPEKDLVDGLADAMVVLRAMFPGLSKDASRKVSAALFGVMAEIETARGELDPIKMPAGSFDPADPDTAGRLVVLALIAQPPTPLAEIARTYGSGVYAIYYNGDHPTYASISGTETPIYVGKADPKSSSARNPREQGDRLYGRLKDHRKMIRTVEQYAVENGLSPTIHLADFTCRKLVCATNAQLVAERHLIETFKPVWNAETKICWGISKHGDSAETRSNTRSPWDVMHPGRKDYMTDKVVSGTTPEQIASEIAEHVQANPAYHDRAHIIEHVVDAFAQQVATTSAEVQEKEDELPDETEDAVQNPGEASADE